MVRRPEAGGGARSALALPALLALALCAPGAGGRALEWYSAVVSLEYLDRQTNRTVCSVSESGRFGDSSPKEGALGLVGVPGARDGDPEGCAPDTRFVVPAPGGGGGAAPWVALVAHGGCTLKDKVLVAARRNASAVVIYNEERHGNLTAPLSHAGTGNIVVIMVSYSKGKEILDLVQKEIQVKMTIGVGTRHVQEFINGQSVVFVAIAFITMCPGEGGQAGQVGANGAWAGERAAGAEPGSGPRRWVCRGDGSCSPESSRAVHAGAARPALLLVARRGKQGKPSRADGIFLDNHS